MAKYSVSLKEVGSGRVLRTVVEAESVASASLVAAVDGFDVTDVQLVGRVQVEAPPVANAPVSTEEALYRAEKRVLADRQKEAIPIVIGIVVLLFIVLLARML